MKWAPINKQSEMYTKFSSENCKGTDHLGDAGIHRSVILKRTVGKFSMKG